MHDVLEHLTSYFQRSYWTTIGEKSSVWIHDYVDDVSICPIGTGALQSS